MQSKLEKIEAKVADARKALDRATGKRDAAIAALIRSADQIKVSGRALARLERQRVELRAAERGSKRAAAKSAATSREVDGPVPL